MIKFKALTDFWHNRVLVPAGSVIEMTANEVKYLRHAVEEIKAEVKAVVAKIEPKVEAPKAEDVKTDAKA